MTDVPYFIQKRGCINCAASDLMKKQTGHDYGFDHEVMAICVFQGCHDYGHSIVRPFIDPEAALNWARQQGDPELLEKARDYCSNVKERFGDAFEKIDVSLADLVNEKRE